MHSEHPMSCEVYSRVKMSHADAVSRRPSLSAWLGVRKRIVELPG